jgi:hypothetical protein
MKRILVLTCAVAFCAAFAAAQPQKGNPEGRPFGEAKITETKRAEFEKARKEMLESRKELNDLGKKYRKETDPAKKTELENKIREKAAADYDKNIADMKARSANAKERLGDMDKKLGDAQKPEVRQERINKIVESVKEGKAAGFDRKGGRGNKSGGKKGWGKETKKPAKDKNKDTK